ncbi:hypothetical protein NL676_007914 [Syzygium grande]|nr:hypothetical protein NL676_007914 [Syzygium grande]
MRMAPTTASHRVRKNLITPRPPPARASLAASWLWCILPPAPGSASPTREDRDRALSHSSASPAVFLLQAWLSPRDADRKGGRRRRGVRAKGKGPPT